MGIERWNQWNQFCFNGEGASPEHSQIEHSQQSIAESMMKNGSNWKLNPPSASHLGGFWERRVRHLKHSFYAILGHKGFTNEFLPTMFFLVEQSLNARPLVPGGANAT